MTRATAVAVAVRSIVPLMVAAAGCTEPTLATPQPQTQEAKVIVCAPGSFMSGNECIPVKVDCPPETTLQDGQCVALPAPQKDPEPAQPEPQVVATDTTFEEVLDTRTKRPPRSRQLLITEIQGLESLFAASPAAAADRPRLMRRLAEGYVEFAAAAARDRTQAPGPEDARKAEKIEAAARNAAIKYYAKLVTEYPLFCQSSNAANPAAGTGCNDETLYYVGLEYMRTGQLDQARKSFLKLVQTYPQSSLTPHTYFLFGEMFRKDAMTDPNKWSFAEQAYLEASKYPVSPVLRASFVRLAEVYDQKGDTAKAAFMRQKIQKQFPAPGP